MSTNRPSISKNGTLIPKLNLESHWKDLNLNEKPLTNLNCVNCQKVTKKYEELEIKYSEAKSYYTALIEDMKQSIDLLLNDYIKDKDSISHFITENNKISALRKEIFELK